MRVHYRSDRRGTLLRNPPRRASTRGFTVSPTQRVSTLRDLRWTAYHRSMPREDLADRNQGCGIRKCTTTVRTRITGTTKTTLREKPASHRFAEDRSSRPTMTVASNAKRMHALINDARTGNNCGGHSAEVLAVQAQPGRTGCATQSTTKARRTTQAAIAGERVATWVLVGMSTGYRTGTPVERSLSAPC